jgi:hypothetical protein
MVRIFTLYQIPRCFKYSIAFIYIQGRIVKVTAVEFEAKSAHAHFKVDAASVPSS